MQGSAEPLFSVVLTTRNRPELLSEAVDSVLTQTIDDWELVVVDDASTPAASIPSEPRIRVIRLDTQHGAGGARNAGIATARGRYFTFLDDDDQYTDDRLEMVCPALERAPIVVCGSRFADQPERTNRSLDGHVGDTILDAETPNPGATTVDRAHFLPFDARWFGVEDIDWWLRITATTPVVTVSSVGYLIKYRAQSEAAGLSLRVQENYALLESHADYFRTHRRARAFRLKRIGLMSLAVGDRRGARRAFARSLRAHPSAANLWHLARSCVPRRHR